MDGRLMMMTSRSVPRTLGKTSGGERSQARALLDTDSGKVLRERMPLSLLKEAAQSKILPVQLRRELALAIWVRSVLLDDDATAWELIPVLQDLTPELKQDLDAYLGAKNHAARKFAAAFVILKFPGMRPSMNTGVGRLTPLNRIDNYPDNWWCSVSLEAKHNTTFGNFYRTQYWISDPLRTLYPDGEVKFPEFLGKAQKLAATSEWEQLGALGTAPSYLSQQGIAWARRHPEDPRAPEALHLAVKSTRYGCIDKETSTFSKHAFHLLHKRYPNSPWAAKTKYWY